jgi:hypothetical protein
MSDQPESRWDDTRRAWSEVGERFADVGRRVKDQYRQREPEVSGAVDEARTSVRDAVEGLVEQLDRAFTAVGDTLRESQAKESLQTAARSLRSALTATFSELGQEVRQQFARKSSGGETPDAQTAEVDTDTPENADGASGGTSGGATPTGDAPI